MSKNKTVARIGSILSGIAGLCAFVNIIAMMVMRFMHAGTVVAGSYNFKPGVVLGAPYMHSSGAFMAVWSIMCVSLAGCFLACVLSSLACCAGIICSHFGKFKEAMVH